MTLVSNWHMTRCWILLNHKTRPCRIYGIVGLVSSVLQSYVRRANLNPDDTSLQVGTGKDLDEAAAGHVLEQRTGSYSHHGSFPHALAQAFIPLNLEPASQGMMREISSDPQKADSSLCINSHAR